MKALMFKVNNKDTIFIANFEHYNLHKTFWGTTKNCESKNLILKNVNSFFFVRDWDVKC